MHHNLQGWATHASGDAGLGDSLLWFTHINALISELQRAGVSVIACTSVLQCENPRNPIRQIAGELGVDALIELSVLRAALASGHTSELTFPS